MQTALRKLEREVLIERAVRGDYAVTDPMVVIWLDRVRQAPGSAEK